MESNDCEEDATAALFASWSPGPDPAVDDAVESKLLVPGLAAVVVGVAFSVVVGGKDVPPVESAVNVWRPIVMPLESTVTC